MGWTFLEFFAGGGLARAGLGGEWRCLLANDIDPKKTATYLENWGSDALVEGDVGALDFRTIRERPNLAWASFPCQDVSQAGAGAGLDGARSGAFWPFWRFIQGLHSSGYEPDLIVIENVCGMVTSRDGRDFDAICDAMDKCSYKMGAIVIDASLFLPQSRPRVFLIGIRNGLRIPGEVLSKTPGLFHTAAIQRFASERLSADPAKWVWWHCPPPSNKVNPLSDILETDPETVSWHSAAKTDALLDLMSDHTLRKVGLIRHAGIEAVGTVYRRMRPNKEGVKIQRAEVRFDGLSGCLRAPTGGSSRQNLLFVDRERTRSRLLSGREAARLMGLPDTFILPSNEYDSYRISGEGVAVPVVRHLAQSIFEHVLTWNIEPNVIANTKRVQGVTA